MRAEAWGAPQLLQAVVPSTAPAMGLGDPPEQTGQA
jgi:hypothetical protein